MHEHEARLERLEAERRDAPKAGRKLAIPTAALVGGAGPSRSGEIVVRVEDLAVGYLPGRGAIAAGRLGRDRADASSRGRRSSPPSAASGSASSGRTAPARRRCCGRSPATCRRSTASLTFGNAVQLGYLAQLRERGDRRARPCSTRCWRPIPVTAGEARAYLARFLFRGDDAFKEVRLLSGGERSRLELALLGIQPSNLLLLDEPTNHLDIPAREAIEAFMADSPATLLVVSHDRRLLETVCERLWVVGDGAAVAFDGGYREWRAAVAGWLDRRGGARGWRRRGCRGGRRPPVARSPVPTARRLTGPVARAPVRCGSAGAGPPPTPPRAGRVGRRRSCRRMRIGGRRRLLRGS